ncbi:MAG: TetR/AcrR family transcriptional regulator [Armatimonadota bacterium]|nr:TetR/AcrR family transcriptional regulator [Armatimonadota bacterium]MDR7433976.1 TetR/AcrR family transcriptional regulator [Armatimonadota bacterium]
MVRLTKEEKRKLVEARRRQILEAARKVFAKRGFEGARISEVAKEAGVAEGTIYNYFRSKEDLLIHIPEHIVAPAIAPLQRARPSSVEELESLLSLAARNIVSFMTRNSDFLKVFVSALPALTPRAKEAYMQLLPLRAASVLEQIVRAGQERGFLRPDLNAAVAARAMPGMLMTFVMFQEVLLGRPLVPLSYEEIIQEVVRLFLLGALPRGHPIPSSWRTRRTQKTRRT